MSQCRVNVDFSAEVGCMKIEIVIVWLEGESLESKESLHVIRSYSYVLLFMPDKLHGAEPTLTKLLLGYEI